MDWFSIYGSGPEKHSAPVTVRAEIPGTQNYFVVDTPPNHLSAPYSVRAKIARGISDAREIIMGPYEIAAK